MRMQKVLPSLIHKSQTGFMKGRNIGENIMKLQALMEFCDRQKILGVIISVDFQKAFDTVSWIAIDNALKAFGYGENFRNMIKTLYKDTWCTTLNNGKWGEWFQIKKGCRQGCPVSALIFVQTAEILGIKIRTNIKIRGIQVNGSEVKACQYADDLWTALMPHVDDINEFLEEMEKFHLYSGLKMNYSKSIAFQIGPVRKDSQFITKKTLAWTQEPVKILGIWIHPDPKISEALNYDALLEKSKRILKQWSGRNLSWMGKIVIINSLVSSLFAYRLAVLPTPSEEFFKKYKTIVLDFLWKGGKSHVRYTKITQDYHHGGLKLVDLKNKEISLKAKWPIYFKDRDEKWFYPKKLDHRIWQSNTNCKDVVYITKKFQALKIFTDVWTAWSKGFAFDPEEVQEFAEQKIWGNSHIRRAGLPMINQIYLNSMFDTVGQIKHEAENRLLTYKEFTDIYGNILSVMQFNSLKAALPTMWRIEIREMELTVPDNTRYECFENKKNLSKEIYWKLTEKDERPSLTYWEKELNVKLSFEQVEWDKIFIKCFKITNATKLRNFHYKIINKVLITNSQLSRYMDISSKCTLCKKEEETMLHLLFECEKVQQLWKNLQKWIKYFIGQTVECDKTMIILHTYEGKHKELINLFILVLKRYIYVARCKKEQIHFQGYIQLIHHTMKVERIAAIQADSLNKYYKKWRPYLENQ